MYKIERIGFNVKHTREQNKQMRDALVKVLDAIQPGESFTISSKEEMEKVNSLKRTRPITIKIRKNRVYCVGRDTSAAMKNILKESHNSRVDRTLLKNKLNSLKEGESLSVESNRIKNVQNLVRSMYMSVKVKKQKGVRGMHNVTCVSRW